MVVEEQYFIDTFVHTIILFTRYPATWMSFNNQLTSTLYKCKSTLYHNKMLLLTIKKKYIYLIWGWTIFFYPDINNDTKKSVNFLYLIILLIDEYLMIMLIKLIPQTCWLSNHIKLKIKIKSIRLFRGPKQVI